jgi:hypothetical protein
MSKLKNIIGQLNDTDFSVIFDSLILNSAEKSAYLLKYLREGKLNDAKIMDHLNVNSNAYYTLRSRLNEKIEEHLLAQLESPRTDLLKKVANIQEIIFGKKKAIAITTLKKLEKELIDYDLSNELTVIYKTLKKLHIFSPDYYHYSQLYNKHVAYTLALDKSEDILALYMKKFGNYFLTGSDSEKIELSVLKLEMQNVCKLYMSHRLHVYDSALNIFHRLFVEPEGSTSDAVEEPIEDTLNDIDALFETYNLDSLYFHLRTLFNFLRLQYYSHYKVYKKAEKYHDLLNENLAAFIGNFDLYTFTSMILVTKMERAIRSNQESALYDELETIFYDFDCESADSAKFIIYYSYRALCCYFVGKYDEASKVLNDLLNTISFKKYQEVLLEVKCFLLIIYTLEKDEDLFNQLLGSIQRQIRLLGKEESQNNLHLLKILKASFQETGKVREQKSKLSASKIDFSNQTLFSPLMYIDMDSLVARLNN